MGKWLVRIRIILVSTWAIEYPLQLVLLAESVHPKLWICCSGAGWSMLTVQRRIWEPRDYIARYAWREFTNNPD
jgi:hypothetical protein